MHAFAAAKYIKREAIVPELADAFIFLDIKLEVDEQEKADASAFIEDIKLEVGEPEQMEHSAFLDTDIKLEANERDFRHQVRHEVVHWSGPRDVFEEYNLLLSEQQEDPNALLDGATKMILATKVHHTEFMAAALEKTANSFKYNDQMARDVEGNASGSAGADKEAKRPKNNLSAALSRFKKEMLFESDLYTGLYLREVNARIQEETRYWKGIVQALAQSQVQAKKLAGRRGTRGRNEYGPNLFGRYKLKRDPFHN